MVGLNYLYVICAAQHSRRSFRELAEQIYSERHVRAEKYRYLFCRFIDKRDVRLAQTRCRNDCRSFCADRIFEQTRQGGRG